MIMGACLGFHELCWSRTSSPLTLYPHIGQLELLGWTPWYLRHPYSNVCRPDSWTLRSIVIKWFYLLTSIKLKSLIPGFLCQGIRSSSTNSIKFLLYCYRWSSEIPLSSIAWRQLQMIQRNRFPEVLHNGHSFQQKISTHKKIKK